VPTLPSGTVTFLFTDIEASTRQWESDAPTMNAAVANHDQVLRETFEAHGGYVVKSTGDGMLAVFDRATSAVEAAADAQVALRSAELPAARMAAHTGEAFERDSDYFGPAVNRAARLTAIGHGGQVLISQSTEQLVSGFELRDLGEHRLRDLSRPERVFQLCIASLPMSFPPLRSLESYPTNLPAQMTAFVGREDEMGDTARRVSQHRVVTLTGVGGVGKTRLALQAAADLLPEYPDGVFVVELGGVTDAEAVDESVAAALVVQQQTGETITDSLLAFLTNKRLLLVLDNCEHLLDAAARLVSRIIAAAPDVHVLATGREALRIDGEQVVTVPSLALPEDVDSTELAAETEAVRLFVDRARAVRPEFALTPDNVAAVTQLCRRLDGVPLAIELAAARVRSMAPTEIAERLDQRFRLLTGGTRTAASRHQTLRRAIDWSYDALEPAEQTLLGRLAVCLGGFDLGAAEAIGAGGSVDALDVDDALGRLVDKSLVLAADLASMTRYKMLETIREYALERLDATGETAQVRTRHAEHYTAFAERAAAGLKGAQERIWLGRVDHELDNLRAAVMWSLASGDTHLACGCVRALGLQGLRIEPAVSSWAEDIVECAAAHDDPAYPVAIGVSGWALMGEGRRDEAAVRLDDAVSRLDASTPDDVACRVLSCASGMSVFFGRSPATLAARWVHAADAAQDDYERALARNMLAVGYDYANDRTAAVATAEECLRLARKCASPSAIAYCCFTTAMVYAEDDPARALELLDESQRSAEAGANHYAYITAAGIRNALLYRSGNYEAAARAYLDAALQAYDYGRREQEANMLAALAASLEANGIVEPAAVIIGWVLSIARIPDVTGSALFNVFGERLLRLADDQYASPHARGAAMSAAEILDYARRQIVEAE
jgi:predicted ATPase/class 3 adenylate cyclase